MTFIIQGTACDYIFGVSCSISFSLSSLLQVCKAGQDRTAMAIEPSLVIQKANEILCGISQPSVCSEVLMSSRGAEYISDVIEVYRVSKRMEGGMKSFSIDCERLQLVLRDIELAWNNLQAFLSMCPSVLQKLPAPSAFDYEAKEMTSDSRLCLQRCCGVCLLERLDQQASPEPIGNMLQFGERSYHPSCANFWLHCVDSSLPVLSCRMSNNKPAEEPEVSFCNTKETDVVYSYSLTKYNT
ncbi:synergin gamma-like isoform X2 [Lithobates pipiens]